MCLMKKYLLILLSVICLGSCAEDTSIDVTVMPPATTTGANTFGCLVDGWVYVGGRYNNKDFGGWAAKSFLYNEKEDKLTGYISVTFDYNISFTILSPQEGKNAVLTDLQFNNDKQEDGIVFISRFDKKDKIISGTFGNENRITNGRFDVHYSKITDSSSGNN